MKQTVSTVHVLDASAERVWENISKGTGVDEWLPVITTCRLDGNKRICSTEQGDMNETILKVDHENRVFQYAIDKQPLLPIEDVVGTMQVIDADGKTKLHWSLIFTLGNDASFDAVKQAIENLYTAGANGLERLSQ